MVDLIREPVVCFIFVASLFTINFCKKSIKIKTLLDSLIEVHLDQKRFLEGVHALRFGCSSFDQSVGFVRASSD